jgi:Glycosyl transferase family 2.
MKIISDGISVVAVSMNRTHHLIQSIPSWQKALKTIKEPFEIIVLDWGSEIPVINTWNINLKRINRRNWHLSLAYNIAIQFSKYNKVLKLDADSILEENFFLKNILEENNFLTGDWRTAKNENERHLNGVVFMFRSLFFKISGYNERIKTYGYDDTDFYERASSFSSRKFLDFDTIRHLPHTDESRSEIDIQTSINSNMLLAHKQKWMGPMTKIIEIDTIPVKISNIRKKLYIETVNGLCNRLRSFASAAVIACAMNRDLGLIWIPSDHCNAKFNDLFDTFHLKNCLPVNFYLYDKKLSFSKHLASELAIPSFSKIPSFSSENLHSTNLSSFSLPSMSSSPEEDIYIISSSVINNKYTNWLKESEFLKTYLHPKKELWSVIEKIDAKNLIGVHIRMGQDASYDKTDGWDDTAKKSWEMWRTRSHLSVFSKKMKDIVTDSPCQKFFLSADNQFIYDEMFKQFGNCIIRIPRTIYDRSLKQLKYAVIDMILLSRTKYLLGSNWSTFTELAQKLGNKKLYLAGVDF